MPHTKSPHDRAQKSAPQCAICKGELWVCENHPDKAWGYGDGCCGGAGMPCKCNPNAMFAPGMHGGITFGTMPFLN